MEKKIKITNFIGSHLFRKVVPVWPSPLSTFIKKFIEGPKWHRSSVKMTKLGHFSQRGVNLGPPLEDRGLKYNFSFIFFIKHSRVAHRLGWAVLGLNRGPNHLLQFGTF